MADNTMPDVRRMIVQATSALCWHVRGHNSVAAQNVEYHAEELLKAMDAFYSGRDHDAKDQDLDA